MDKLKEIENAMQSINEIDNKKDRYVFADEWLLNTLRILITDNNKQSIENIIELFYKAKDWKLCQSTQHITDQKNGITIEVVNEKMITPNIE